MADLPFGHRTSTASLADLNQVRIEFNFLPKEVPQEVLEQHQGTLDHRLRSIRLPKGDRPTQGALIAFGNDPWFWSPGAYMHFLGFDGDKVTTPIRTQAELKSQLGDVLQ